MLRSFINHKELIIHKLINNLLAVHFEENTFVYSHSIILLIICK